MTEHDDSHNLMAMAQDYGIDVSESQSRCLLDFLGMMLRKNEVINLTAIRDYDKGIVLHLLDSLLFLKGIEGHVKQPSYSFVDMGCGAGFPGIPVAIMSQEAKGMLCDSTKKKISAVREFVSLLGMEDRLTTYDGRLETLPLESTQRYDVAFARALAPLPALIEYATPLLNMGGVLVVSKGTPQRDELRAGSQTADLLGMKEVEKIELELPEGYGHRTILVYGKMDVSSVNLPRQVGFAVKHPLV